MRYCYNRERDEIKLGSRECNMTLRRINYNICVPPSHVVSLNMGVNKKIFGTIYYTFLIFGGLASLSDLGTKKEN